MTDPGEITPWSFAAARRPEELSSFRDNRRILLQVFFIHVCLIFIPSVWGLMQPDTPLTIEVSLIDAPLMTAPEVGEPTRAIEPPGDPAPPVEPTPPAPVEPTPIAPPEPTPPSPPEPDPTVPPEPAPVTPPIVRPSPREPAPIVPPIVRPPVREVAPVRPEPIRRPPAPPQQSGNRPNQQLRPDNQTRGQAQGEVSRNLPGGTRQSEAEYGNLVGQFINNILPDPGSTLLDGEIQKVTIKITVNPSGKVINKALVTPSTNNATNEVVKIMLRDLKEVPKPPDGKTKTLELILKFERNK